jgi:hypothetical protein
LLKQLAFPLVTDISGGEVTNQEISRDFDKLKGVFRSNGMQTG